MILINERKDNGLIAQERKKFLTSCCRERERERERERDREKAAMYVSEP